MNLWSRYLFGASLVLGIGVTIFAERSPAGWGPASILAMVLAVSAFLICSILDDQRERSAIGSVEDQEAGLPG